MQVKPIADLEAALNDPPPTSRNLLDSETTPRGNQPTPQTLHIQMAQIIQSNQKMSSARSRQHHEETVRQEQDLVALPDQMTGINADSLGASEPANLDDTVR